MGWTVPVPPCHFCAYRDEDVLPGEILCRHQGSTNKGSYRHEQINPPDQPTGTHGGVVLSMRDEHRYHLSVQPANVMIDFHVFPYY